MSVYKGSRFGSGDDLSAAETERSWADVDLKLHEAVREYLKIHEEFGVLVIDNLIRLVLSRTYINMKARKLLTAQKILEVAKVLIKYRAPEIYA
jgi:hypothetical protein